MRRIIVVLLKKLNQGDGMQQQAPQNKTLIQNLIEGTTHCTTGIFGIVSGVFSFCQNKIVEKINSLARWHYNLNQEREELRMLREKLKKDIEKHKKAENELQDTVDRKVNEKLDSMYVTISELEKSIAVLQKKEDTLSSSNHELQHQKNSLKHTLQQEAQDLNNLKHDKSILEKSVSVLKNKKTNLETAIKQLKEEAAALNAEIERLTRNICSINQTRHQYNHSYEHNTYSQSLFSSEISSGFLEHQNNSTSLLLANRQNSSDDY
jgi:chromosome segregation ATPase